MKSQSLLNNSLLVLVIMATSILTVAPYARAASLDDKIEALQIDVPRFKEIIQLVARNDGYPTKQLHDEFWGLVLTRIPDSPRNIGESLSTSLIQPMQYQKELWNSIQLSAMSHSVVSTEKLAALRSQIPKSKLTKDYFQRENLMLQAAATGQPYLTRSGENWNLTVEAAKNNIAGLVQTEERLRKLFNPDWQSQQ